MEAVKTEAAPRNADTTATAAKSAADAAAQQSALSFAPAGIMFYLFVLSGLADLVVICVFQDIGQHSRPEDENTPGAWVLTKVVE